MDQDDLDKMWKNPRRGAAQRAVALPPALDPAPKIGESFPNWNGQIREWDWALLLEVASFYNKSFGVVYTDTEAEFQKKVEFWLTKSV